MNSCGISVSIDIMFLVPLLHPHTSTRQLGFNNAVAAVSFAAFGPGTGPIWMDTVICTGNESSIDQCIFPGWGLNDCSHYEDAGVICSSEWCGLVYILYK